MLSSVIMKIATADKCYISDYFHSFENLDFLPMDQYLFLKGSVRISDHPTEKERALLWKRNSKGNVSWLPVD